MFTINFMFIVSYGHEFLKCLWLRVREEKKGDMTFVYYIALSIIIKCVSCIQEKFNQN